MVGVAITGSQGFNKSGPGTMQLNAAGSYSGTTIVVAGELDVTKTGALGTGTVIIDDPSSLALDGTGGGVALSNSIVVYVYSNAEILSLAGSNTLSGPITLEAYASIDVQSGSTLTISGAIGEAGGHYGVTKIAGGTLVYGSAQANTYTNTTTVVQGELDLNSGAANRAIGGDLYIGNGSSGLATVKYMGSRQLPTTTNVTVANSAATLNLNGFSDSINHLTVTGGLVSLPAGSNLTAAGLTMTGGDINTGTGSTFTLSGDATINDSALGLTIDGTGTLELGTGTPTFTINATTPRVGLDIAIPIDGSAGLNQAGGVMEFGAAAADTDSGTVTVNAGTLLLSAPGGAAVAGPLVVGLGSDTAVVQETAADQIDDGSDVTVNANGTFDLNGQSDTIGSLTVSGGRRDDRDRLLTVGGLLTMTGGSITTDPATGLVTLGGDVQINSSSTTAMIVGNLDLDASPCIFIITGGAASGVDLDVQAAISGTGGGMTVTGGVLQLDGTNTFTGIVDIEPGATVIATNAAALGAGTDNSIVVSGGELELSSATGIAIANPLSVAGSGISAPARSSTRPGPMPSRATSP